MYCLIGNADILYEGWLGWIKYIDTNGANTSFSGVNNSNRPFEVKNNTFQYGDSYPGTNYVIEMGNVIWIMTDITHNGTGNPQPKMDWFTSIVEYYSNSTTEYINASNITAYVSSDNITYGELGTFTDGGSNCSNAINTVNWNAGTMGADPFAGEGLTNDSFEIYIVFKLTIPADSPTDIFWSVASDSFKTYIGVE